MSLNFSLPFFKPTYHLLNSPLTLSPYSNLISSSSRSVSINCDISLTAPISSKYTIYPNKATTFLSVSSFSSFTKVENTSNKDIEEMLLKADEYNKKLNHNSIQDVFSTDKDSYDKVYADLLKLTDDGLMGYIEIPKINIKLPIYHSTSEESLAKGVGHLEGSSLPVGGLGTHAVLAAHRGLPTSKLFSDLDKVLIGDKFYISILGETLAYQVDNVAIVVPSQLDLLDINKDKDYITLVTCTPYGINSHRLLVRGVRVEETKEEITNELENKELIYLSNDDKLLIGIIEGIFILLCINIIYTLVKKK